ncbi:MAG: hypothetical protein EOP87_22185, partial [Verrucomicrobiaceae bacterium]
MKSVLTACLLAVLAALSSAQEEPDKRFVVVPFGDLTGTPPKPVPLFFSVTAGVTATVGVESITGEQKLDFKIHQGNPGTLTLALSGTGEVESVAGEGLKDWSVRIAADGARFLDLRPSFDPEHPPATLSVTVRTRTGMATGAVPLLLPSPGEATGFALSVTLAAESGTDLRVSKAEGLLSLDASDHRRFLGHGVATLEVTAIPSGHAFPDLEMIGSRLTGRVAEDGNSVAFKLITTARSRKENARADLAAGIALSGLVSGDGWHVVLRDARYDLVAERGGDLPVELDFVAPVKRRGDWRVLDFNLPAGVVVPLTLGGLEKGVSFDASQAVVPEQEGEVWRGFLPADGMAALAWRPTGAVTDGALFYSSSEITDVRIGSGLLRQNSRIAFRILQGKLGSIRMRLDGPGEILGVEGTNVLGWKVLPAEGDGART